MICRSREQHRSVGTWCTTLLRLVLGIVGVDALGTLAPEGSVAQTFLDDYFTDISHALVRMAASLSYTSDPGLAWPADEGDRQG